MIRDRAGVTVAAPAEEIEDFACAKMLDQVRAILARFRQAGMTTDELLRVMQDEIKALDGGARGERS